MNGSCLLSLVSRLWLQFSPNKADAPSRKFATHRPSPTKARKGLSEGMLTKRMVWPITNGQ